jgi:glutamate-1-semialdehyde 2,1-aminomutase
MLAVLETYEVEGAIERLDDRGRCLRTGLADVIRRHGLDDRILLMGRPCNLVFGTLDGAGERSQPFRTLFLQELITRGVIGPSFVVSTALSDEDIDRTVEAVDGALAVYGRALSDGIEGLLRGRPVKPVFRPFA